MSGVGLWVVTCKMLWFKLLQRDDTEVLDEPLYASFLKATGFDRPYRDELLSKMVCQFRVINLGIEEKIV